MGDPQLFFFFAFLTQVTHFLTAVENFRVSVLKDVCAQNVATYRFFLNLPLRKVMIYFCQKDQKLGGHRPRFGENMPRSIPLNR